MQVKYVGPKPIISHRGIEFDNNKEDKYVYLNVVLQLLKVLDHDYFENKTYTYQTDAQRLSDMDMTYALEKVCPNYAELTQRRSDIIEDDIEDDLRRARENKLLTDLDKEVLETNISMMHDYILQRAINKSFYYCAIEALAELLKKDHIDYIIAPMYQNFAHIFHSVQGVLTQQKFPIDTKIEIYQENEQLFVKLQIINN